MNILMITDNDPAGTGIAFCKAINGLTEYNCRLITRSERYGFDYEADIHLPECGDDIYDEIRDLLTDADIIHFHMLSDESVLLGPLKVSDYMAGKYIVHHHHGHPEFRSNGAFFREKYSQNHRPVLVSTPDLLRFIPEATWIPNPVPIDDPLLSMTEEQTGDNVIVCQAPTRKEIKNTSDFICTAEQLKKNIGIEYLVIEGKRNRECLEIKRKCHVHFDHMQGYYGISSLESLSMGKPVIAGIDEWNRKHILDFTGAKRLPWHIARNRDELYRVLSRLCSDRCERVMSSRESRYFMEQYWHEARVVNRLVGVYNDHTSQN